MSDDKIHFQVITLTGVVYDKMVSLVEVPLADGFIGIMAGNEPVLGSVIDGPAKCVFDDDKKDYFYVGEGLLEVNNNNVNLLVEDAEKGEDIDPIRALGALERAKVVLTEKLSPDEKKSAEADLRRAQARVKARTLYNDQADII